MIERDDKWLAAVRTELGQSVDEIDDATSSKLEQIRHQALARKTSRSLPSLLLPAAVLATACLALALIIYIPEQQPKQKEMIDDLDLITASQSLDLYEDLDFYEWLDAYDLSG